MNFTCYLYCGLADGWARKVGVNVSDRRARLLPNGLIICEAITPDSGGPLRMPLAVRFLHYGMAATHYRRD